MEAMKAEYPNGHKWIKRYADNQTADSIVAYKKSPLKTAISFAVSLEHIARWPR